MKDPLRNEVLLYIEDDAHALILRSVLLLVIVRIFRSFHFELRSMKKDSKRTEFSVEMIVSIEKFSIFF